MDEKLAFVSLFALRKTFFQGPVFIVKPNFETLTWGGGGGLTIPQDNSCAPRGPGRRESDGVTLGWV